LKESLHNNLIKFKFVKSLLEIDRTIAWVALIRSISSLGFALSIPFLSLYLNEELSIPVTKIGLMLTISGIIGSSMGAFGGSLSDRFGRKRLLVPSLASRSITFLLIAYLVWSKQIFLVFAIFWTISGILGSSIMPITDAIVADVTPVKKRREAYGVIRVSGNLGWALGPAIGGLIIGFGYHWLFVSTAITLIIVTILTSAKVKETWTPQPVGVKSNTFRLIKEDPYVVLFLGVTLLLTLVRGQLLMTVSIHSSSNLGLPKMQIGMFFFINAMIVAILQVPLAHKIRHLKSLRLMIIAAILYAVGYLGVGFASGFMGVVTGIIIVTFGEMIESPTASAYVSSLAPAGKSGAYMGAYSMVLMMGWAVGPLIGGLLLDYTEKPIHVWMGISLIALIAGLGYVLLSMFGRRQKLSRIE
jgi:MFS family permease